MANENLHTLYTYDTDLAVVCTRCGHRSLVPMKKICSWDGKGDMTPISDVAKRMRCTVCHIKQSHAFVPSNKEYAEQWVHGLIVEVLGLEDLG